MLIDIDHFKRVNDRFGHPVGDALLRRTASTIRNCLPLGGMVARFGGEEFAVLLPGQNLSSAIEEAERLRLAVFGQSLASRRIGERLSAVSISLGLAELLRSEDVAAMLERADRALYRAKQEGRNRACWQPMEADTAASDATVPATGNSTYEKIWT
jgi:diguanylate cyclase (GGDEF)-like protein